MDKKPEKLSEILERLGRINSKEDAEKLLNLVKGMTSPPLFAEDNAVDKIENVLLLRGL